MDAVSEAVQGGEGVRLVDADALPSALFQKHVHDEEELEPMLYFEDAVKVIENAPTIDAIPVEWLKARKTKYYEDWGLVPVSVEEALTMWQKEQEAQDG